MFVAKKLVSRLIFPLPLSLELLLVGLVLLWATKRQKTGKVLVSLGAILLLLLSHSSVADLLLKPLENRYPPLKDPGALSARAIEPPIRWIVVLGGGHVEDDRLPLTARPSAPTLVRLVEGIRIHQQLAGSKLILTVGGPGAAQDMSELSRVLGVDPGALVLEIGARDTEEEAQRVYRLAGPDPLVLVTSASHMPRAMALFEQHGLHPIAAPTEYRQSPPGWRSPEELLPSVEELYNSTRAVYEGLGLGWAKVRGRI